MIKVDHQSMLSVLTRVCRMHRVWPLNEVCHTIREQGGVTKMNLTELATHPHVLEVSVVARRHPKWGERPMAFVTLHPQHSQRWAGRHSEFEQDLKQYARAQLPGFACPEWISVVSELPVCFLSVTDMISNTLWCFSPRKPQLVRSSKPNSGRLQRSCS